jgi:predicted dinucleotide-binding enzyme
MASCHPPHLKGGIMRIGIIGTGNMGRAVGVRFAHLGHDVLFGAREAGQAAEAAALAGHLAQAGTTDDAAHHGELLVWTIRDPDPAAVLANPALLDGKIVVNLNNRDYATDVQGGRWFDTAIAEAAQAHSPRARIVKAFNLIAMETLDTRPEALRGAGAQMFIAGEDPEAKAKVAGLLQELGYEAVDVGAGPVAIRAVEALGDVIRLMMIGAKHGGRVNLQLRSLPEPDLHSIGTRAASNYH